MPGMPKKCLRAWDFRAHNPPESPLPWGSIRHRSLGKQTGTGTPAGQIGRQAARRGVDGGRSPTTFSSPPRLPKSGAVASATCEQSRLTKRERETSPSVASPEAEQGRIGRRRSEPTLRDPASIRVPFLQRQTPRNGIEGPMQQTDSGFDAAHEARALRAESWERRRRRFYRSRLDRHTHELMALSAPRARTRPSCGAGSPDAGRARQVSASLRS